MMILIVGGRYGSPSSQSNVVEERKKYDDDYISVTRREFETADQKNIPIVIFVDKNVYAEYLTYKENHSYFSDQAVQGQFKFAHVDHINVFKFIDKIYGKPLKAFERVEEIEGYIRLQFAGMFYLYLESLKKKADDSKILDTIAELNSVALQMNEMLTSVGRKVLDKDGEEYEKVIEGQLSIMCDFFADKLGSLIKFNNEISEEKLSSLDLERAAKAIYDQVLRVEIPAMKIKGSELAEWMAFRQETDSRILSALQASLHQVSEEINIERFDYRQLNKVFHEKVLPFIKNRKYEVMLLDKMKGVLRGELTESPF